MKRVQKDLKKMKHIRKLNGVDEMERYRSRKSNSELPRKMGMLAQLLVHFDKFREPKI
jgi:hypothetical protein